MKSRRINFDNSHAIFQVLVFIIDYIVGKYWSSPVYHDLAPPGEDDKQDDETKDGTKEDKEFEQEHTESTNVRKRAKVTPIASVACLESRYFH